MKNKNVLEFLISINITFSAIFMLSSDLPGMSGKGNQKSRQKLSPSPKSLATSHLPQARFEPVHWWVTSSFRPLTLDTSLDTLVPQNKLISTSYWHKIFKFLFHKKHQRLMNHQGLIISIFKKPYLWLDTLPLPWEVFLDFLKLPSVDCSPSCPYRRGRCPPVSLASHPPASSPLSPGPLS